MEQEQKKQVMCPGCGATLLVNNTTGTSKRIVSCPNCQASIVVSFAGEMPTPPSSHIPPPPSAQQVQASVATPASAPVSPPTLESEFPVEPEQQKQKGGRGKAWLIGLLSGFVVVLAGLLVWFLLNKDKPKYVDDDESLWVESDEIMTDDQTSAIPMSDDRDWEMSASIAPEVSASVKPEASASVAPEASDLYQGERQENNRLYYGCVSDPDGYTNIRREASLTSPITKRYNTGEYLYYIPMSNGWSKVYSANSTSTFIGYMHTSRIVRVNKVVNTDMHRFIESKISVLKSRKLTENDIRNYDSETMRLLRNSLFATHNYIFKSKDLDAFFREYSWYSPLYKDVSSTFSQIELYNIGFLKEHE